MSFLARVFSGSAAHFKNIYLFIFIYLAVLGLSCSMQDL